MRNARTSSERPSVLLYVTRVRLRLYCRGCQGLDLEFSSTAASSRSGPGEGVAVSPGCLADFRDALVDVARWRLRGAPAGPVPQSARGPERTVGSDPSGVHEHDAMSASPAVMAWPGACPAPTPGGGDAGPMTSATDVGPARWGQGCPRGGKGRRKCQSWGGRRA